MKTKTYKKSLYYPEYKLKIKSISRELERFLKRNKFANLISAIEKGIHSADFYGISVEDPSKISYIPKSRQNMFKDIWNKNERKQKAIHAKPSKFFSGVFDNSDLQKLSKIFLFNNKKFKNKFKLILSTEVCRYYNQKNYNSESGNLGSSCMRYSYLQEAIEFYENIGTKLLVLLNEEDKVCGRALYWEEFNYIDRLYLENDNYSFFFEEYADEHKCSMYGDKRIHRERSMTIRISEDDPLPYLDTFKYLTQKKDGIFVLSDYSGDVCLEETEGHSYLEMEEEHYECYECGERFNNEDDLYRCTDGEGRCEECCVYCNDINEYVENDDAVYSEYYGYSICKDNSAFSDYENSYISEDDSDFIYIEDEEDYIPENKIVYSDIYEKKILEEKAIWIEKYNTYIYENDMFINDDNENDILDEILEEYNIDKIESEDKENAII